MPSTLTTYIRGFHGVLEILHLQCHLHTYKQHHILYNQGFPQRAYLISAALGKNKFILFSIATADLGVICGCGFLCVLSDHT